MELSSRTHRKLYHKPPFCVNHGEHRGFTEDTELSIANLRELRASSVNSVVKKNILRPNTVYGLVTSYGSGFACRKPGMSASGVFNIIRLPSSIALSILW